MSLIMQILGRVTVALFLSTSLLAAERKQVVSVVVEHWPPWQIARGNKKQVSAGIAVELVQELFERLNIDVKLKTRPWKRALSELEKGTSDLIPLVAKDAERGVYMLFTIPVYTDQLLLMYSTDRFKTFEWSHWIDLKPYRLQTVRSYSYGSTWDKAVQKFGLSVSASTNDSQSIRMLIAGRIDFIPLFFVNGSTMKKEIPGHEKLRFAKKPIDEIPFHMGISKKSFLATRLVEINATLQQMKNDGSYQRILKDLCAAKC